MATLPNPLRSPAAAGLELPPGRLVDDTVDGTWTEPLLWYGDEPASPGSWAAIRAAGRPVGLLPVLIDGGMRTQWPEHWDLAPARTTYAGDHDAEHVLSEAWEAYAEDELNDAPADWPGLAPVPAEAGPDTPDGLAAEIADQLTGMGFSPAGMRAGLVPARRSADIPAAIGWSGPLNHENDVARLCAVLRSWEDRFGARVVVLGFDTMVVSVSRPPTTPAEAEALAAEHFAFCPDNIQQSTLNTLQAYAEKALLKQETWAFWWD
ncbi:DUF4253 domain-containing protein [Streptomyces sp. ITFR-6]|uniref:DUF4253 domain-containing protein n=1 Tax=Streptomyces sp. ITFR-6 TaxID=3075197 RepID=UPI00288AF235|nr:DUF4253 domain-containing protein [Streptomyces sp. ITFR-6]WNI31109.1 DUF4253 domain-containing protein [Streptomyces sp. ITFR-6]